MGKVVCVWIVLVLDSILVCAQMKDQIPLQQEKKSGDGTVCFHKPENQNLMIPPPLAYEKWKLKSSAKTSTTSFEVTYEGFSPEAQASFQKAVDIWSSLIETEIPIRILAVWKPIADNSGSTNTILGGASPWTYFANFEGAPYVSTWYPVALAEKIRNQELNDSSDPDIYAQFNSAFSNWYLGTDGVPQAGKTDLTTVALHEIGHGLGIIKSYNVNGANGEIANLYSPLHIIYDHFIENNSDKNLVQNFVPPSSALKSELTTSPLWFRTAQLEKVLGVFDSRARLFAPSTYQPGSSIAHLDENTYNGTIDALMTPQVGNAEVIHNPGSIILKMLADMGWVNTQIIHTQLPNTEDVSIPYEVKAKFIADQKDQTGTNYGYNPNEVKIHYTTNGTSFTPVAMTPTGIANEFSATIPATGSAVIYGYYISVRDNLDRTLTKPGILKEDGKSPVQRYYTFEAGPDTKGPFFSHVPVAFVKASDTEFKIEAIVSDNIALANVFVDFKITKGGVTGALQTLPMNLVAGTDSTYSQTIPYGGLGLSNGDKIEYLIRATDQATIPNTKSIPSDAPGFYNVNVVSLAPTQDSYGNDFNNIGASSMDFFGSPEFSIRIEAGFSDGAIHTNHPYPEGEGFPNNRFEWVYQLRIPIRVKETEATLKFDEIVLIEPGKDGVTFPSEDFFDYVVVDGSKDGGVTWTTIANGYDSRDFAPWLTRYNSAISNDISTAVGDPGLFKTRILNLQDKFDTNDEVVIRFRLFSDPGAAGWGWAIDNLKIQIDDIPPTVLHDHSDYVVLGTENLPIVIKPSDASGVDKLFVDFKLNGVAVTTEEIPITEGTTQYTLIQPLDGLIANDLIEYQIRSLDVIGNQTSLPIGAFFKVPIVEFGQPVTQYISDFNSTTTDFVGNFFSVSQPTGFSNGAIQSTHPYPNGFGLTNSTSNYTYTLTKPIIVSATNPYITFNEVALVEYTGTSVKDFVVVEGSKDSGITWESLVNPYSALAFSTWRSAYDVGSNGTSSLFRSRLINLTASGKFSAGDNVLIRFKLSADGANNSWGWAIDDLSIQGPITGVSEVSDLFVSIYPNPVHGNVFTLEVKGLEASSVHVQITNLLGKQLVSESVSLPRSITLKEFSTTTWTDGIYVVRINLEDGRTVTKKLVKTAQ